MTANCRHKVTGQVWLTSDMHFGHEKMYALPFQDADGNPIRPFASAQEADDHMVQAWNETVRPGDKVYVLGDVAIPRSGLSRLAELHGDKVLVMGNHDCPHEKRLGQYFRAVRAYWRLDNFSLSHVPIHPSSLGKFHANIHGHLHGGMVTFPDGTRDPRYINVCVERTGFRPIAYEQIVSEHRRDYAKLAELLLV